MDGFKEYDRYDGLGLAELVRRKEISPAELVEEAIRRIETVNPQINAVIHPMYDLARQRVRQGLPEGPFRGVPFLLKDLLVHYAGVPTRSGSCFFRDFVPDHDSEIVRRYRQAGVVILGKTNTPELGLVPYTEPVLFGPSRNPWNLSRTTGGSSGGSGAAVAARLVPVAHGNDGGGSIRIPASCCGVFGLKPTRGRTPMGPDIGEAWRGMAINHVLTLSVRDSAAMLDATAGPDVGAPYIIPPPERPFLEEVGRDPGRLRIAFTTRPLLPGTVHPDCVRGVEETGRLCQDLGHIVEEAAPQIDGHAFARDFLTMVCAETRADIAEGEALTGKKARYEEFEPATWALGLLGGQISAGEYACALRSLQRAARRVGAFFEKYDVLLTPTLASPPPEIGWLQPTGAKASALKLLGSLNAGALLNKLAGIEALAEEVFAFIPFTPVFNVTGQPAMSVPLVWNDKGLPIGMHFVARFGDEATLFRLAGQLEQARPWFDRRPPVGG
ncbi:MAG: amidase [Thermoflexales bacterium]|nr:amidase [Thermoflexales bacterium]